MAKTVELTDLIITQMLINYEKQNVYVEYKLTDASGNIWGGNVVSSAIFWVTMPAQPRVNDFQLPASYFPTLISLQNDADAALTSAFLV